MWGNVTARIRGAEKLAQALSVAVTSPALLHLRWITERAARVRSCVAVVAVAWISGVAGGTPARAETPEDPVRKQARALATAGVKAYEVADYRTAHAKLEESFGLLRVPSLGLWSARALVKLRRFVEAEQRYRAVSLLEVGPSDSPVQNSSKVDAALELAELLPRIPSLSFRFGGVVPDALELEVDGRVVGGMDYARAQRVDPGRHVVVGRQGAEKTVVVLDLAEGEHEEVWLRFAEPHAAGVEVPAVNPGIVGERADRRSDALQTAGWITLAVGGASVATGVVAYLSSRDAHSDVERLDSCSTLSCSAASPDAHRTYEKWRTLQLAGLLSGGLLSAAGVTLLIAGNGDEDPAEPTESARLQLRLGPTSAALIGTF